MKALIYNGPRMLSIEETTVPVPSAGEVLLKVDAVGICGSEIEGYLGKSSVRVPPLIMGHEFSGTIVQIADHVDNLAVGDKVVVNPMINCTQCDCCQKGRTNICTQRSFIGINRPGAYSQYITVPARLAVRLPSSIDSSLASLAEPVAVCLHSLVLAGGNPFGPLVIIGAGSIGLLTLQISKAMGYGPVVVLDTFEARLEYAKSLGADTVIMSRNIEAKQIVTHLGDEGTNLVIDCVGIEETRNLSVDIVNTGGTVVLLGLGQEYTGFPINHAIRQEILVRSSYSYTHAEFKQAVQLLTQGKIRTDGWMIERSMTEASEAFEGLLSREIPQCKVILKPWM